MSSVLRLYGLAVLTGIVAAAAATVSPANAGSPTVVINEIAWMGNADNPADEWFELFNSGDTSVSLKGWGLYEEDGAVLIEPLAGILPAHSYHLVERSDEETVPSVPASQPPTSWGGHGLRDSGEIVVLKDASGNTMERINAADGWFAGDKSDRRTMERIDHAAPADDPASWTTSTSSGGTPGRANSTDRETASPPPPGVENAQTNDSDASPEAGPTITAEPDAMPSEPTSAPSLPTILLSEIFPSPKTADATDEWIELFNDSTTAVRLDGWSIEDISGGIRRYTFPVETTVTGNGFFVIPRTTSNITLGNDTDGLTLRQPDGSVVGTIVYSGGATGHAFAAVNGQWYWTAIPTPGATNVLPVPPAPSSNAIPPLLAATAPPNNPPASEETPPAEPNTLQERPSVPKRSQRALWTVIAGVGVVAAAAASITAWQSRGNIERSENEEL